MATGKFGVFCVRASERDRHPISTHRTWEAASKRADAEMRAFNRQLGAQNAMISYSVFELVNCEWV